MCVSSHTWWPATEGVGHHSPLLKAMFICVGLAGLQACQRGSVLAGAGVSEWRLCLRCTISVLDYLMCVQNHLQVRREVG